MERKIFLEDLEIGMPGTGYPLLAMPEIIIGRENFEEINGNKLLLNSISRVHCVILRYDCGYRDIEDFNRTVPVSMFAIRDLYSKNGTYVNGRNIGREIRDLNDSDIVSLGDYRFKVKFYR